MNVTVEGQLKEWLEQDGRHDLADAPFVEIDDGEYQKALTHCARLHPDYSTEKSQAWAAFAVAAKNRVSASTREIVGGEAANSLTRVSGEVEKVTKEFRNFKGEFQSIAEALGVVKDEVTQAVDSQTKTVWVALDASAKIQYECTEKVQSSIGNGLVGVEGSIDGLKEFLKTEFNARHSDELEAIGRERRRAIWLWIWRIAIALLLCGLLTAKLAHGQTTTQIRAIDPSTGFPVNVTATTSCYTSIHNCLDVNLPGVIHVICDSGCSGGGGGGGTSSNFGSAFPTAGTAIGLSNGTNMIALTVGQQLAALSVPVVLTAAQISTLTPLTSVAVTNVGTFAVQATLSAETTKVIGTVNQGTSPWVVSGAVTPGTGVFQVGPTSAANTLSNQFFTQLTDGTHGNTFMSTTTSSKYGADINLLSILGTAPTTAGFLDIKGADGNVFVRSQSASTFPVNATLQSGSTTTVTQATGTNLHAVLDSTSTTAVTQATGSNLHAQLDSGSTTTVTQATGTNLHTVVDSGTITTVTTLTGITNALPAGTNLIGEVTPVATATTTDAASGCYLQSAASTNSTNCKNASGNFYGFRAVNTTSTIYYLRMYNSSSAPTCSSATGFIESIPIPAASGSGAGIATITTIPIGYSTGISFCFTGGGSSTDNTNAATGVYVTIYYK